MTSSVGPPYNQLQSLDDAIDHLVGRMLDQFGLRSPRVKRWEGVHGNAKAPALPPDEEESSGSEP